MSFLIASTHPLNITCPGFQIFIPGWFFEMLCCGPGDYFSSIIPISIIYFNYQVVEQKILMPFSFCETICNVDEMDEYKIYRRLQHIKKSDLMVQLEGFLRIILHSCSAPSLASVF